MTDRTEWFYQKKWGVFLHYLEGRMNNPDHPSNMGRGATGWDECLREFDADRFADALQQVGCGYVMITTMQLKKYLLAPNDTYDRITGYKPGEASPRTDFIRNLQQALERRGIALFLYFTGDGPAFDKQAGDAFGYRGYHPGEVKVTREFVEKWASVMREWSLRYGDKIKGWWLDGCYRIIGYDKELLTIMANAARAGNPDALVACNYYGCLDEYGCLLHQVRKGSPVCDFSAGEQVYFEDMPYAPFIEGTRWHILSFLGKSPDNTEISGWGSLGCRYTGEYMHDYVKEIHRRGGVVTIDICPFRDGHIDPEQYAVLEHLKTI